MYSHYMSAIVIGDWLGLFVALIVIGWVVGRIMMKIITIKCCWVGCFCLCGIVIIIVVITIVAIVIVIAIFIVIHWTFVIFCK